jgi:hypothetical protein
MDRYFRAPPEAQVVPVDYLQTPFDLLNICNNEVDYGNDPGAAPADGHDLACLEL